MTRQSRGQQPSTMAANAGEEVALRDAECRDEEHEDTRDTRTWRQKLSDILNSNPVQYGIIALVVLDSVIVMLELLIDIGVIVIPEASTEVVNNTYGFNESLLELEHSNHSDDVTDHVVFHVTNHGHEVVRRWAAAASEHASHGADHSSSEDDDVIVTSNDTWHNATHNATHGEHEEHAHTNKEMMEHAMHYASLTILVIFVIEVIAKVLAEGMHFLKHKAEVFDALIVVVSFSLDVAFMFASVSSAVQDVAGLMVLLRLWRVTRIINGVIMSVKKDAAKKINELKVAKAKADDEVTRLQGLLSSLETEVVALKARLLNQDHLEDANSGIGMEERRNSTDANPDVDLGYQETSFDVFPDNLYGGQDTPAEVELGSNQASLGSSCYRLDTHQGPWDAFEGEQEVVFVPPSTTADSRKPGWQDSLGTSVDIEGVRPRDDVETST